MIGDNGENRLFNYRPLFEFALGMMAGILLCVNIPDPYNYIFSAALAVFGCVLMLFKLHRFAVFALSALIGLCAAAIALPDDFKEGNARISGVVCAVEEKGGETTVILDQVKLNGAAFNMRAKLSFVGKIGGYGLKIGDALSADASARRPSLSFSTYDERKIMLSKGVGCIAETESFSITGEHRLPLYEFVHSIRTAVENRIRLAFAEDSGIFSALLIGVKNELSDERAEAYRSSGTAHLLAISGFHMGIIVGAISLVIPKRKRVLKLCSILLFAAAYCTIAAYTPGIVRAAIMTVCLLAANALQRRPDMLSSLSLAAIVILLFNPFQIYSLGFRFSFSAVFGIALLSGSITRGLQSIRLPKSLSSAAAVCLSATAGTLMFQLRYYSSFAPYSVIANLFAVPAFSAVVLLGFAVTLIAFIFPQAAPILALLPRSILFIVEKLLSLMSKLPFASIEFLPPNEIACIIYLVLLFAASEYVLRSKRKRLELALPILILFTFSYFMGIIIA